MPISPSPVVVRTIAPHERDGVLNLLDEWISREFFGRYLNHDPAFRNDLCFVGEIDSRLVSTLQVFEKQVRVRGATIRVGGIGNVFTTETHRGEGTASRLLSAAIAAMEADGFDASLLFATRLDFYARHGWRSHNRHLDFIDAASAPPSTAYTIDSFNQTRDLDEVMALYSVHSRNWPGSTVRDRRYWLGQLHYAGNPSEDFLLARDPTNANKIVAYARGTELYGYYVIMEYGYLPGHSAAVVDLICRLHGRERGALPGTLTQLAPEPTVRATLTDRGLSIQSIDDGFWMWRVISPDSLAVKLGLPSAEVEREELWQDLFPAERSVFWLADRF